MHASELIGEREHRIPPHAGVQGECGGDSPVVLQIEAETVAIKLLEFAAALPKAENIAKQEVSAGGMAVFFNVSIPLIDEAIDRLEMETVISEEDEMGQRVVFDTE